ncbi:hypothetical protein ACFVHB_20580 [Kitasatospora sp. NPDC127111]|uniref:hypothetical protein n=1 Tax=Kitasatospora sp. NPDC127111 TaxID=3345363 RepID=UPI003624C31A
MTTEKLDQALTRRGFTTRGLRLRAAAVIVAITAGVSGVLLYSLTNVLGPDTVCNGVVSADALHDALGPGRISEEDNNEPAPLRDSGSSCTAVVSTGVFGGHRSVLVGVRSDRNSAVFEAEAGARLFAASANGGSAGGVTAPVAWALLPEGCGTGGLRARVDATKGGSVGDGELARLAVATANGLAAQRGCTAPNLPAPGHLSAQGVKQELDADKVCGLPGLTVPGGASAARGYTQQVTTAFDPLWSCDVGLGGTAATFAIGTEPRLRVPDADKDAPVAFGRAHWTMDLSSPNNDEVVVTCQGKPAYFKLRLLGNRTLFPDTTELWKQFLTAGGKAIGCEPILP